MDFLKKSFANHLIIAGGIIVAGFIILGFFKTIRLINSWETGRPARVSSPPSTPTPSQTPLPPDGCATCFGIEHNNTELVVKSGQVLILELPRDQYAIENLLVISEPADIVEKIEMQASRSDHWAKEFKFNAPGIADIIVPSNDPAVSDFRLSFVIE